LEPLSLYAPFWSIFLTWSGLSDGFFERSSATAPDTIAADCDVPLPRKYRASSMPSGWLTSMEEFGTRSPWMCAPGATKSGARALPHFAPAENVLTVSSVMVWVPSESDEPTARM